MWFVIPFEFNGNLMTARRIRRSLGRHLTIIIYPGTTMCLTSDQGDFTSTTHEPARLAALEPDSSSA